MFKTLCLSFSLRNAYRVNSILYALKQVPLLKKLLPDRLYQIHGFKVFANVISVIWELLSAFLGKFVYFLTMVCGIGVLYGKLPTDQVFLHILLILTLIGAYMNTGIFNPSRDKYYAMILMRMNARDYTLVNYGYAILKVIVGFIPFTVFFGLSRGVPLWMCLLIPFGVAGAKLLVAAYALRNYEKRGRVANENRMDTYQWILTGVLLAAAYGLPAAGVALPVELSMGLMLLLILLGAVSVYKILSFESYREINQEMLAQNRSQMDAVKDVQKQASRKAISADTSITSSRTGFEYLNELFIRRHQKILWRATVKLTAVSLFLLGGGLLALYLAPEIRMHVNDMLLNWIPYFVFIMYAINRGTGFTQALFMNCDHSLLTYSFYKQPQCVLKLFRIRLREIVKINALPALVIGGGLDILLFASGGTEDPLNYVVLVVSILCMSVFFSIHYLTIYYLLQPYNAGTELKSGTYQLVMFLTYLPCWLLMQVRIPIFVFGLACIGFCAAYSVAACFLVYRFAPKTFRIRA